MFPPAELYPNSTESIWMLFDLCDRKACNRLHRLRDIYQEDSDLEALGPDHMILMLFPGAARRLAS